MPYARTDVRTALHAAREAGKPVDGLIVGDRETALTLERWGFLPVDHAATDKRIADWYVANGLAVKGGDTPERVSDTPRDMPGDTRGDTPGVSTTSAALAAADAAIEAARAAIAAARAMGSATA